nr:reverse transcriptase domain-containing protein [Tanacetum cinerariifolium]
MFVPSDSTLLKLQTAEDLHGDALLHYDAEIKLMNLILLSIPNDIYNSVDACTSAKDMWKKVERLMRGTIQNKVDRETRFTNEFDQFVAEPGEAIVSVYNRFAQLMNDLERNDMHFPIQFKKLVNTSRAKKLEKSYDPLALVVYTGSSSINTSSYYVTHPTSVVDYDDEYQQDDIQTNSKDPLTSAMTLQNSSSVNTSTVQCYNCSEKGHYARNYPKPRVRDSKYFMEQMLLAKQDEAGVILTDEQNDFLFFDALRMKQIKDLSANICLMAIIQQTNHSSDVGPSYDSTFVSEVQSSSINENEEQMYLTHTKIIDSTIGDNQIDSTIIFDTPTGNFTGRQDPHNHLRFFNKVTSTFRHPEVPNTTIKLLLFPFSLEGEARIWLDKEPSRSILTWEDLVSKFINQFFPPSKTTYLQNEITNFLQKPNETFNEAWERFKDLLRQCPHHGFSELHQLDTFDNALNPNDQDALDSAAGGNFLDKIPHECLSIIKSKSKVRYSRSRITDVRANTNAPLSSSSLSNSFDLQQIDASLEDKLDIRMNRFKKSLNDMKNSFVTPTAPLKAVEEVKENQEKDKIGSKPDKNGKRGEARESLK